MKKITKISSNSVWEDSVGYSRAIKIGNQIEVSGTTAGGHQGEYAQTVAIIEQVAKVLEELGSSLKDVVRTRMYVTDISKWEEVGRAHRDFFGEIRPATSMVEVAKLIRPDLVVEIEFTAILAS